MIKSKKFKAGNKSLFFFFLISIFSFYFLSGQLAADDKDNPYGIIAHVPDSRSIAMCAELGVKWMRVDFNWFAIEPAKGQFNWQETDRIVKEADSRGLRIFATLAYSPDWANGGKANQYPAHNPQDWYDFIFFTVLRYRASIKHWGMWNEPNLPGFFIGTADDYVNDILKIGHDAVKAADPGGFVLGPELSHRTKSPYNWDIWMKRILESGGMYIDIITHHIYKDSPQKIFRLLKGFTWPWEPPSVTETINQSGCAGKPVWITETGWSTHDIDPEDQAEMIKELLELNELYGWPDKIFVYKLLDDKIRNQRFGVMKSKIKLKPAFNAYKYHITRYWSSFDTVPPYPQNNNFPDYYVIEAEYDSAHMQGRRENDGWACDPVLHSPDYLCLGPEIAALPEETCSAAFRLLIDNIEKDNSDIAVIDIYDCAAGKVLASRKINRQEFNSPFLYQDFILSFASSADRRIMPRVFWCGNVYTRVNRITVVGGK